MAELNILVCVKQVPDPEGPTSAFEVDAAARKVTPKGIPPVLSPFDENALEAAIRVKEAAGGSITMLSVGNNLSKAVMLKALASGADRLVTVDDPSCDHEVLDAFATASLLAAAVRKAGPFDLILSTGLGEFLDSPSLQIFYQNVFAHLADGGVFYTSATARERGSDYLLRAFELNTHYRGKEDIGQILRRMPWTNVDLEQDATRLQTFVRAVR